MVFICFRRLAKSPELLSNKEQIKSREVSGSSWKILLNVVILYQIILMDQLGSMLPCGGVMGGG